MVGPLAFKCLKLSVACISLFPASFALLYLTWLAASLFMLEVWNWAGCLLLIAVHWTCFCWYSSRLLMLSGGGPVYDKHCGVNKPRHGRKAKKAEESSPLPCSPLRTA
ncbi:hypothetical protein BJ912DRAFT_282446 [Pholiota molesta]|nr:hypothetical protein BJ912DRAFT_282446 [Pholiota molesta]